MHTLNDQGENGLSNIQFQGAIWTSAETTRDLGYITCSMCPDPSQVSSGYVSAYMSGLTAPVY